MKDQSWREITAALHPWKHVLDDCRPGDRAGFRYLADEYVAEVQKQFPVLPARFRNPIARRYSTIWKKGGSQQALEFLRDTLERLPMASYSLAFSDSELIDFADKRARAFSRHLAYLGGPSREAYRVLSEKAETIGVIPPTLDKPGITIAGAIARMCDSIWWRRQLRKTHGRTVEQAARDFGLVHKRAGIYSSDEALYRRKGQKRRNRQMLEECVAVNEEGQEYSLAELSDLSVSNPTIRRGELMTRMRGFEEVAAQLDHVGVFFTITCPSRYHAYFGKEQFNGSPRRNPKFDATLTPRDGQQHLSQVWARVRAKLAREGIRPYGFRVAEPHHCGCVHWHALLFMPVSEVDKVSEIFRHYALEDSPQEPGAQKHRFKIQLIDNSKGSATGYLAKYIAKNIDGHTLDSDLYGTEIDEAIERVDAWAACWGIRQFQQVGGPPVSVWRELRRMEHHDHGLMEMARAAADAGDWASYVNAMGGPMVERAALPIRSAYLQDIDTRTGELPLNRYGELAPGRLIGVEHQGTITITRIHTWTIKREPPQPLPTCTVVTDAENASLAETATAHPRSDLGEHAKIRGANAPPWSSVNNCTPTKGETRLNRKVVSAPPRKTETCFGTRLARPS